MPAAPSAGSGRKTMCRFASDSGVGVAMKWLWVILGFALLMQWSAVTMAWSHASIGTTKPTKWMPCATAIKTSAPTAFASRKVSSSRGESPPIRRVRLLQLSLRLRRLSLRLPRNLYLSLPVTSRHRIGRRDLSSSCQDTPRTVAPTTTATSTTTTTTTTTTITII